MPKYTLRVNGRTHDVEGEPADNLLSVLRYDLGLTGSKYGCGEGHCGACTVLIENQLARSCTTRLGAVAGKSITTIEGLLKERHMPRVSEYSPLQKLEIQTPAMRVHEVTGVQSVDLRMPETAGVTKLVRHGTGPFLVELL